MGQGAQCMSDLPKSFCHCHGDADSYLHQLGSRLKPAPGGPSMYGPDQGKFWEPA